MRKFSFFFVKFCFNFREIENAKNNEKILRKFRGKTEIMGKTRKFFEQIRKDRKSLLTQEMERYNFHKITAEHVKIRYGHGLTQGSKTEEFF